MRGPDGVVLAAATGLIVGYALLVVLFFAVKRVIEVRWRKSTGFRLPPRDEVSNEPRRRVVTRYLPSFGQGKGQLTIVPGKVQVDTSRRPLAIQTHGTVIAVRARFALTK